MPTSRPQHLSFIAETVRQMNPQSILDIGCGFGSKGMLFREYTDIWNGRYNRGSWETVIDGVEANQSYITPLQRMVYNEIYCGDIREVIKKLGFYDLVFLGDVIEHLSVEDGTALLARLRKHAKKVLIATPIKTYQRSPRDPYQGQYEQHVSSFPLELLEPQYQKVFQDGNVRVIMSGSMERPLYCSKGMSFFGDRAKKLWGFTDYNPDLDREYPTWFFALYFDVDYLTLSRHEGPAYFYWHRTDIAILERNREKYLPIILKANGVHVTFSEGRQAKLAALGIKSDLYPCFFSAMNSYARSYKHSKTPQVYITMHPGREVEYGLIPLVQAAKELPNFGFHIIGVGEYAEALPGNVYLHDWTDERASDEQTAGYQASIRMDAADGRSQTELKGILRGQYNYSLTDYNGDVSAFIADLRKLETYEEPNLTVVPRLNDLSWLTKVR